MFSANEETDDIQTGDLRYLLLPFLQGELLAASAESRLLRLHQATAVYDRSGLPQKAHMLSLTSRTRASGMQVLAAVQMPAAEPGLAQPAGCGGGGAHHGSPARAEDSPLQGGQAAAQRCPGRAGRCAGVPQPLQL